MFRSGFAQNGHQNWTQRKIWARNTAVVAFSKFWGWNLAKRTMDLDSARENDGNRLLGCIFRSPDR